MILAWDTCIANGGDDQLTSPRSIVSKLSILSSNFGIDSVISRLSSALRSR